MLRCPYVPGLLVEAIRRRTAQRSRRGIQTADLQKYVLTYQYGTSVKTTRNKAFLMCVGMDCLAVSCVRLNKKGHHV